MQLPIWLLLAIAICSEVIGTTALRESDGFTRPLPVAIMTVTYVFSFYLLAVIVRDFPLGLAYAIWAGLGTSAIVVVGALRFGDTVTPVAVGGIGLVIVGIVIINLSGAH